jgi:DNA-binding LytR/AlgR family response regulator
MINILIAEDEEILRVSLIKKLNAFWPEANIIASAETGTKALSLLNELKPDVAFLDIQMGDLSGIDVAQKAKHRCHIIFVTAYDQYAIQAFDTGAIDYLLKPYSDKRLKECIERVKDQLNSLPRDLSEILKELSAPQYLTRLKIQIGNKLWLINIKDVICFKAYGRYIKVVTKDRESVLKMTLKAIVEQLDQNVFWQIHRSTVINTEQLDYIENKENELMLAYMRAMKDPVTISRSFSSQFKNINLEQ